VEHVAEGQENNRGLLRGVLEEVMGSSKISQFLNSEMAADADGVLVSLASLSDVDVRIKRYPGRPSCSPRGSPPRTGASSDDAGTGLTRRSVSADFSGTQMYARPRG
jgi:hypothetical protein